MRRFLLAAAAVTILVPLAGCGGSYTVLGSGVPGWYPVEAHTCRVARDGVSASYLAAWVRHGFDEDFGAPVWNYDQEMLVAVLMGPISILGGSVNVDSVKIQGSNVELNVTHTPPPAGFLGPAIQIDWRGPWQIIRMERHDGAVKLRRNNDLPVTGSQVTYAAMSVEEFGIRKQRFADSGTGFSLAGDAPGADLKCPIDGVTPLVAAELPAEGTYTDLSSTEYFCPKHGQYWILHSQGALVGTVSYWWGPYVPGKY